MKFTDMENLLLSVEGPEDGSGQDAARGDGETGAVQEPNGSAPSTLKSKDGQWIHELGDPVDPPAQSGSRAGAELEAQRDGCEGIFASG